MAATVGGHDGFGWENVVKNIARTLPDRPLACGVDIGAPIYG